ncbi:hypothetical protein HYR99_21880 [Candidatus Poribacteria bacterium]|nr:hypothetical protein [Candidatus Poribacteria bacterium]
MVGQETFTNHPTTQPPNHLTAFGSRGFGWEITSLNRYYGLLGSFHLEMEFRGCLKPASLRPFVTLRTCTELVEVAGSERSEGTVEATL